MIGDVWADRLNRAALEPLPAAYISDDLRRREGDRVWRIPYRDSPDDTGAASLYILLILEHQHRSEHTMALRLSTYTGLLYETLLQSKLIQRRQRLPPVLPVVIYSGVRPWRAPLALSELIEPASAELAAYQLQMRYLLVDEGALVRAGGLPDGNLAAMLFRLEHSQSQSFPIWR